MPIGRKQTSGEVFDEAVKWQELAAIVREAWPNLDINARRAFYMTKDFSAKRFRELTGIEVEVDAE